MKDLVHRAVQDQSAKPLSPLEAQIFGMLSADRITTLAAIMDGLYEGRDNEPESKIVAVSISKIRRKLPDVDIAFDRGAGGYLLVNPGSRPPTGRPQGRPEIWTPERVEQLKRLHAEGRSYSEMARALGEGISREAATGKARRLGLPERSATFHKETSIINSRPARPARPSPGPGPSGSIKPPRIAREDAWKPLPGDTHKPWTERRFTECKWPLDIGPETFSCCRPVERAGYCAAHVRMAFQAQAPSTKARARADFSKSARRFP